MGRRRRSSLADEWVEVLALLPWWACLIVAVVCYVLLHAHAVSPLPPVQVGGRVDVVPSVTRALAMGGQYIVPMLTLVAAAISAYRRRQRSGLLKQASTNPSAEGLNAMSWREFEMLIGEVFRRQGFKVMETGKGGPDGGVDLRLQRGGETHLVQCKQRKAYRVGVETVRELYGVMAASGSAGGYVVTSGRFTPEAEKFAEGRNVTLLDGTAVKALIDKLPASAPADRVAAPRDTTLHAEQPKALGCPSCGAPLTKRVARRGAKAGVEFWGCSTYPACRGTRAA
jgi:restriction system protein